MKKFLFLLLLFTGIVNGQIVNIPDANFKAKLLSLNIDTNSDGLIQQTEALQVSTLNLSGAGITTFEGINFFANLTFLDCYNNTPSSLDISSLVNLKEFSCGRLYTLTPTISSLVLPITNTITKLTVVNTLLSNIDLNNFTLLEELAIHSNPIANLSFPNNPLLKNLHFGYNSALQSVDFSNLPLLKTISYQSQQVTANIDFSPLTNLENFLIAIEGNFITNLNLNIFPNLKVLLVNSSYNNNAVSTIQMSNCLQLKEVYLQGINNINVIDLSMFPLLTDCQIWGANITNINLKNGSTTNTFDFKNCNINFICANDYDILAINNALSTGINNYLSVVNSYCTFVPGGNYNTITGKLIFDADNNGCDLFDLPQPNIRLNVTQLGINNATFSNNLGNYTFYTTFANQVLEPNVDNPTWFNFSPTSSIINFPGTNSIINQDFCIQAVGNHADIEIALAPVDFARPGFDATYKIVFKNKGNQMQSGNIILNFDDTRIDFVSATPTPNLTALNNLRWNYTNLMPFENRSILVKLNVNSPVETPAVNIGDILNFTATINPIIGDDIPADNTFNYNQIVVGSFDPNDITCLEGDSVAPSQIGEYLHYIINFENTGNFPAENIVLQDIIDENIFDVSTLQVMNSSDPVSARITGNIAEFIFKNIHLPGGGHGNILIKIKTKPTVQVGNIASKRADIFFDYNAPVDTGIANTTFAALSNNSFIIDNSISINPNPANDFINIKSVANIKNVQLYDIQGRLLQTKLGDENSIKMNISELSIGTYFLKITSENGSKIQKLIKE